MLRIQNINKIQHKTLGKKNFYVERVEEKFDMDEKNMEMLWSKRMRYDILEEVAKTSKNLNSLSFNFKTSSQLSFL